MIVPLIGNLAKTLGGLSTGVLPAYAKVLNAIGPANDGLFSAWT